MPNEESRIQEPRARSGSAADDQLPIQPVEKPILCGPYDEPTAHWVYERETGEARKLEGRRRAGYWFKSNRVSGSQLALPTLEEEQFDELPLVNRLREDVKRWRASDYRGAETLTRELLRYWTREDRPRRLFFCQREAVETVIYLAEILLAGRQPHFKSALLSGDLALLRDDPGIAGLSALTRLGCKMATGSGKTVVMAMLVAWSFLNHARKPGDPRFPGAALVCCPNLTIKERLQVLRPDHPDNYYDKFELLPVKYRPLLQRGKVLITNWHLFAPESEHVDGGKSYLVVDKGPESPDAFAQRVLGDLYDHAPLLVLNDEGHHAYRPAPPASEQDAEAARVAAEDRQEATVWVSGLDRINQAVGIRFAVDLSATPFYLSGSGYAEGDPFPWLVGDFSLVDAIESGIVKIPRLPVSDTTGRPEPEYFRLWKHINERIQPGERLPGKARRPKPEAVWREVQGALNTLAGQWIERFRLIEAASPGQDRVPPVMIIVCDNTDIAEVLYRNISGEESIEVVEDRSDDDEGDDEETPTRKRKPKTKTTYGAGKLFPRHFANTPDRRYTLRIDTKLLAEAESENPSSNKKAAAEELRRVVATVGKAGEAGEHVRCVVSVAMLTEGWDANNVTHILGVRAFGSQLLCEQVIGRGLRRMDYVPDPETGLLAEEYVDVYGVPFSVIPFKGRPKQAAAPEDRPFNHVKALPERRDFEMRFPVVEGYAFALRHNVIKADVGDMARLVIEPSDEPTATFVQPTVGYRIGGPSSLGPGPFTVQDRETYYRLTHLQAIEFEIARSVVATLVGDGAATPDQRGNPRLRLASRHQLFPQVLRLVLRYVSEKVDFHGADPRELGLEKYVDRVVSRLINAIEPDDTQGEAPLLPILNRYKPRGTTAEVDFKTTRPCVFTRFSQINQVAADTNTWEQIATFRLEEAVVAGWVKYYARNDHLGLLIPYELYGISHSYEPDFLVRLADDRIVVLEIKGYEPNETLAKHAAANRWVSAVNNWGQLGKWEFRVCRDPQLLGRMIESWSRAPAAGVT